MVVIIINIVLVQHALIIIIVHDSCLKLQLEDYRKGESTADG